MKTKNRLDIGFNNNGFEEWDGLTAFTETFIVDLKGISQIVSAKRDFAFFGKMVAGEIGYEVF